LNSRWVVLNALRNIGKDIHSRKHKPGRIQRWNDQGTEWWRVEGNMQFFFYAGETTTGNRDKAILDRQLSSNIYLW